MLNHEWGHIAQMQFLGIPRFLLATAVPSIFQLGVSLKGENYYKKPWEASASILGGDWGRAYTKADVVVSALYLFAAKFANPLWSFFFALWGW